MTATMYVVSALPEPTVSVEAASSLRALCDTNRALLAPHITTFGQLHAGLDHVPVR
jgi:hypothetical protein